MEKISPHQVKQVAAELGINLTPRSSRQLSRLANQECQQRQQQGENLEPETIISMALLSVAQQK